MVMATILLLDLCLRLIRLLSSLFDGCYYHIMVPNIMIVSSLLVYTKKKNFEIFLVSNIKLHKSYNNIQRNLINCLFINIYSIVI